MSLLTPQVNLNTRLAIQKSFSNVFSGLTSGRLVYFVDGRMKPVEHLTDFISGTANEINVADDGDGTVTIGLVDPLIVSKGGSGAATFTDHSILLGSGTDAFTALGAATNGQLPIGSTGNDPVLATLVEGSNVSITNGAGSITIAANIDKFRVQLDATDVSDPPTDDELDSIFGDPTTVGAGFIGIIDDNDAGGDVYFCYTTGTADEWFYVKGTKAIGSVSPVTGNPIGLLLALTYNIP